MKNILFILFIFFFFACSSKKIMYVDSNYVITDNINKSIHYTDSTCNLTIPTSSLYGFYREVDNFPVIIDSKIKSSENILSSREINIWNNRLAKLLNKISIKKEKVVFSIPYKIVLCINNSEYIKTKYPRYIYNHFGEIFSTSSGYRNAIPVYFFTERLDTINKESFIFRDIIKSKIRKEYIVVDRIYANNDITVTILYIVDGKNHYGTDMEGNVVFYDGEIDWNPIKDPIMTFQYIKNYCDPVSIGIFKNLCQRR